MAAKRVDGIQYLRGIAAFFVILIHCNGMMGFPEYFGQSVFDVTGLGQFRTAVFFTISGFINVIVCLTPAGSSRIEPSDFFLKRFVRIIPMMWLAIIAYNSLSTIGSGQTDWPAILRSLFLWPVGELRPNILWTMRHELFFYIIFAIGFLGPRRLRPIAIIWFLTPIPFSMLRTSFPQFFASLDPSLNELLFVLFLEGGANLQFGLGCLLGMLWLRGRYAADVILPGGFATALVLMCVGMTALWAMNSVVSDITLRVVGLTAVAGVTFYAGTLLGRIETWFDKVGELLGNASYSIYLFHTLWLLIFLEAARRLHLNDVAVPGFIVLLVLTCGATVLGIVVHLLVEQPLVRYISRIMTPKRVQPVSA